MELEPQPFTTETPLHHSMMFFNTNSYPSAYRNINNNNLSPQKGVPSDHLILPKPQQLNGSTDKVQGSTGKGRRNSYRPISPREPEEKEGGRTYCTRDSLSPEHNGLNRSSDTHIGLYRLSDENLAFNKYTQTSNSSPNIYHNVQFSPRQGSQIGGRNRNRCHLKTKNPTNTAKDSSTKSPTNSPKDSSPSKQVAAKPNGNVHVNYASDVMVRRAHGLGKRYNSRSDLMRIDPHPSCLLNGGPWDRLNQAIWDVFRGRAQKEKTYETKINLWKNIFIYIRNCLNSYGLFMVGSTMSGFGLENSDVDMCLLTKPFTSDPRLDALHHLNTIRHLLVRNGMTTDPELILAKVPILKFKDEETGFNIDLNCNNSVGIRNTHLLHCYARLDWRVRPLVVVVKLWAQANNINDAKNMTVSSYSWTLMVIHYLQCGVTPPVLPCLHDLVPEIFNSEEKHPTDVQEEILSIKHVRSENSMCLGELVLGFFEYYANFNFNETAISVRTASRLTIDECRFAKAPKNSPYQWKYLCIEEPFDRTNTARSVFDLVVFRHVQGVIKASYHELARTRTLGNVLPVNPGS